jgi:hypothetical protein
VGGRVHLYVCGDGVPDRHTGPAGWHDEAVTSSDVQVPRPGWRRDPVLPATLAELRGPLAGEVGLPLHLFWSGGDPASVRWDLADPTARRSLYEIVLQQGGLEDLRALVNGAELVRLWPALYLPPWVRAAWSELIASATSAA